MYISYSFSKFQLYVVQANPSVYVILFLFILFSNPTSIAQVSAVKQKILWNTQILYLRAGPHHFGTAGMHQSPLAKCVFSSNLPVDTKLKDTSYPEKDPLDLSRVRSKDLDRVRRKSHTKLFAFTRVYLVTVPRT